MTEANGAVSFTAQMLASEACDVGDLLVFDAAAGAWRVATSANRATAAARSQAVALTAYGGSVVGKVQYRSAGIVPASVTDLEPGSESLVRCSSAGRFERIAAGSVNPATDDIVGIAYADGRVNLFFGIPIEELSTIIGGGGGGGSSAGTASQIQATDGAGGFTAVTFGNAGAVLRQTSSTAAAFGAVDMADADAVTGLLPLANQAAPSGTGFVETTSGAWNASATAYPIPVSKGGTNKTALGSALQVLRTNAGATDTEWATVSSGSSSAGTNGQVQSSDGSGGFVAIALGAVGSVLRTTGATTAAFGALDLADSDARTGTLPLGNGGTGLTAVPGSNGQLIYNNSSAYGATANVTYSTGLIVNSSGFVSFGTNPAATGQARFSNNGAGIVFRNAANSGDLPFLTVNGSDQQLISSTATLNLILQPASAIFLRINGSDSLVATASSVAMGRPVHGDSTPYGTNGEITLATTTATLSASQYSRVAFNFTSGAGGTITFPAPASADAAYLKAVRSTVGVSTATLSIGSGTTAAHGANTTGLYLFNTSGVFRVAS